MAEPIIASALKNAKHLSSVDTLAKMRFDAIDTGKLLVSLFDTVDARLLDFLASQLDMLGYNGWILAETEQEKRELLKGAAHLHRIKGTPGGIREVVKRLGFLDVVIEEGWENFTDDSPQPEINPWAYFRVLYVLPANKGVSEQLANNLIGLINAYKPVRSKLANFGFRISGQGEGLEIGESVTINIITV